MATRRARLTMPQLANLRRTRVHRTVRSHDRIGSSSRGLKAPSQAWRKPRPGGVIPTQLSEVKLLGYSKVHTGAAIQTRLARREHTNSRI